MYAPNRLDMQVIGEEGSLHVLEDYLLLQKHGSRDGEKIALPTEKRHGQGGMETAVVRVYEDFIDCVKNHKKPTYGTEPAMASSKISWLGELSDSRKREVKWEDIA
jgi:hypothetical protein